ncbi:MAG: hypothetical protein H7329_08030 [Opitutaceae bacterium]|nr:hypothetical protein [Cytophagales bacterium]
MKAKNLNIKTENLAIPGKPLSEEEFKDMIKAGENSAFITINKLKENIQKWISKLER